MIPTSHNNVIEEYDGLNKEFHEILVPNNHRIAVYIFKPTLNHSGSKNLCIYVLWIDIFREA